MLDEPRQTEFAACTGRGVQPLINDDVNQANTFAVISGRRKGEIFCDKRMGAKRCREIQKLSRRKKSE